MNILEYLSRDLARGKWWREKMLVLFETSTGYAIFKVRNPYTVVIPICNKSQTTRTIVAAS